MKPSSSEIVAGLLLLLAGCILGAALEHNNNWDLTQWISAAECIGLWITGGIGAWFVLHQNRILDNQNSIMERQLDHDQLVLAKDMGRDQVDEIKVIAKGRFRRAAGQRGLLQYAGDDLRIRYPKNLETILAAYRELADGESEIKLPRPEEFLEMMKMYNREIKWPDSI